MLQINGPRRWALSVRTASLLNGLQSHEVALEVMNEPAVAPAQWQPMLEAAYDSIRKRALHLLLVLDGGDDGSADTRKSKRTASFGAAWVYRAMSGCSLLRDKESSDLDPMFIEALRLNPRCWALTRFHHGYDKC
jgi:hypothetical protein